MPRERTGTTATSLSQTVIAGGYCVGCGACAALERSPYQVEMDELGRIQAQLAPGAHDVEQADEICPFGARAANEDTIAAELYPDLPSDPRLGRHKGVWAGHVVEGDFRERGSSGGMGNWLASELLRRGLVDKVLHVRPHADDKLFAYTISSSIEEVRAGNKSRYYPITMRDLLIHIRDNPGRYALVGIPCMIKAARLHARFDPRVRERLHFTIALICGHLKSRAFAEMFAWQMGIHPAGLETIDFRVKNETGRPDQYSISATGLDEDGKQITRQKENKSFFGYLWGHGFFKYRACDYCDDVFGETADITVGDAWLPQYLNEPRGTNVVVTRNAQLHDILMEGQAQGRLALDPLDNDQMAKSQDAGLRHRRLGLAVRLGDAIAKGRWTPPKRVAPYSDGLSRRLRWVYRIRERMSERSHPAFAKALAKNSFRSFERTMRPWMALHDFTNRTIGAKHFIKILVKLALGRQA